MMNHDSKHFSKVKESEVCNDKMHENMIDNDVRDKILSRG